MGEKGEETGSIVCMRDPRAGEIPYRATQDVREGAGLQEKSL